MACQFCGGPKYLLGSLGNMNHYRCRDCGVQTTKQSKKLPRDIFGKVIRKVKKCTANSQ